MTTLAFYIYSPLLAGGVEEAWVRTDTQLHSAGL
jgi:hypothetical protein